MQTLHRVIGGAIALSCLSCGPMSAVAPAGKSPVRPKPAVSAPAVAAKSPAPRPSPSAKPAASNRRKAFARAFFDMLPSSEFAKSQATLGIGSSGGGILSDGASGIVSNNGGGILSDGASGFVGIGGAAYRVAAEERELDRDRELDTAPNYRARVRIYKPEFAGDVRMYDRATYQAQGESAPLLEHYVWDRLEMLPISMVPLKLAVTYPIRVLKSGNFPYVKTITMKATAVATDLEHVSSAEIAYSGGTIHTETPTETGDTAPMDLVITEYAMETDKHLQAEGQNDRGKLVLSLDREGADDLVVGSTHTSPDATVTRLKQTMKPDGSTVRTLSLLDGSLRAEITIGRDRTGTGQVLEGASGQAIGTITWEGTGKGKMTFTDGDSYPIAVY